jgi:hypothetical protein
VGQEVPTEQNRGITLLSSFEILYLLFCASGVGTQHLTILGKYSATEPHCQPTEVLHLKMRQDREGSSSGESSESTVAPYNGHFIGATGS